MTEFDQMGKFVELCILHGKAVQEGNPKKANKIFDQIEHLKKLIRGEHSGAMNPFAASLAHQDPNVQIKSAIASIPYDERAAVGVLKKLEKNKPTPEIAISAQMTLRVLNDGTGEFLRV